MKYAHPETLVNTDWVQEHLDDPDVRLVEVDVDPTLHELGHLPGAIAWDWVSQLSDPIRRDILSQEDFSKLMSQSGIWRNTTVVLYGDNSNWFACWAMWQMKIYEHADVRVMNGGRCRWLEEGREVDITPAFYRRAEYSAPPPDLSHRAMLTDVMRASESGTVGLVDVRSRDEFTGDVLAPPGLPETCQRGGHIPGARNIPWQRNCNPDGTFKAYDQLCRVYESQGITRDQAVIAYCRIGERSSHSWYVLRYLLGYPDVRNYDGSWTEWGNLVGAPIER